MAKKKGSYAGKILRVDLSSGKIEKQDLDLDFAHKYIGGRGFGSRFLYDEVPPEVAPFDPANRLILTPGALFGTAVPAASRTTATSKSPTTGMFGDGHSSGHWGALLKSAGYDMLIIQGAAEKPVYLWIDNDKVEIRDAAKFWGKTTMEADQTLKETLGDWDIGTISIGPAGEKKVRLAGIFSDGIMGTFARTGLGAVMGSKNLKAVATRGTRDIGIVDVPAFKKAYQDYLQVISVDPYVPPATKYGTCRFMYHRVKFGIHGAKNWRLGDFDWKPLDPEVFRSDYQIKASACPMCPVRCRREYRIPTGKYAGTVTKLEWETIARCMTCGVNDPEAVIYFSHLCNQYGMDVEGIGDTIAFAMECYEKGLLTDKETDGIKLRFGNPEVLMEVTRKIAFREGLGDLLAEGSLRAAKAIGKGAEKFAMQVKGSEMSAGDPRGMPVRAVSYATSTRGSDHLRSNPYVEELITPEEGLQFFGSAEAADIFQGLKGKGRLLAWSENFVTIGDLLGLCKFAYYRSAAFPYLRKKGLELATRFYNACNGTDLTEETMFQAGERAFNIEKAFNAREGAGREKDIIPERFFKEGLAGGGPSGGAVVDREKFDLILDEYYEGRGWNEKTGLPKKQTLKRLGLQDIAEDLARRNRLG
ncbi:MAG: aldehyde ferredoxin oxidoreductase family protein [Thermodesulfobacteriota bacterium]|nr:aldehyde ferredoxin oxidoreductase family protein [Thermodesulfobacteriota bacterium]